MGVADDTTFEGLLIENKDDWPVAPSEDANPIDLLAPGSDLHAKTLDYLLGRLESSEKVMRNFYARWSVMEKKFQAYIDLPNWEKLLKQKNDDGKPPSVVGITLPISFAFVSTIVTYLLHTFTGNRPYFPIGAFKEESVEAARMMETVIQYNCDHTRIVKHLHNFFQDGQTYGVGILRTLFVEEEKWRTTTADIPQEGLSGKDQGTTSVKKRVKKVVYQGNDIESVDPFLFFPDPRVPMSEVNKKGEFVFWRNFEGFHQLLQLENDGIYKWVKQAPRALRGDRNSDQASARAIMAGGHSSPGMRVMIPGVKSDFAQVDQCTIDIIPREMGLGESEEVEKWIFTILNKQQIVQAVQFDEDHDMHPICVCEPYSTGHAFGNLGIIDYIAPLQDVTSWLINSHMDNVRRVLNDIFVVDPSAIEMQDLKRPGPGKVIRLKRSAQGRDVRQVLQQLPVADVTRAHIQDAELFIRLAQVLTAISDNVMGIQDSGGRKTATESRIAAQGSVSRLASQARIISAQGFVDLTTMMSLNLQQHMTESFYLAIVGQEGRDKALIEPGMIVGDFHYPVHDGTLPSDKVALFEVWQKVFAVVLQDEQLRQEFDLPKMFEFVAELGGAQNIESMRLKVGTDQGIERQAQAGNIVPLGENKLPQPNGDGSV